jgi:MFS transporter, MHS family, proline/betaine transporter
MISAGDTADRTWPVAKDKMVAAIVASVLGWSLDLFDLFILLYVAPVVGKLFFPSVYPTLSLAAVYASFAVTLLMRPVGSALFGSYSDRYGRRGAMIFAVVGVGVATALFGALPTTEQIGVTAPVIFIVLRLVQGIFVGGVVASTHTIGTESVPPYWRGAMSGLVAGGGGGIGALVASVVYFITTEMFPGDLFAVWGWRCMFFSGILTSILGFFIFNRLEESPLWAELQARGGKTLRAPVRALFSREYLPMLLVNLMVTVGGGAGYYLTSGYLPTFFKVVSKLPSDTTSAILIAASLVVIVAAVLAGHASTLWGRKRVLLVLAIIRIVLLPLCFIMMGRTQDTVSLTFWALLLTFLGNAGYGPQIIFLNERFPTALRATGTGLSWNIGFAVGGIMPTFVSLFAATPADLPAMLAIFSFGISVLFLAGALIIPETKDNLR